LRGWLSEHFSAMFYYQFNYTNNKQATMGRYHDRKNSLATTTKTHKHRGQRKARKLAAQSPVGNAGYGRAGFGGLGLLGLAAAGFVGYKLLSRKSIGGFGMKKSWFSWGKKSSVLPISGLATTGVSSLKSNFVSFQLEI
jgi:hypothetical protein